MPYYNLHFGTGCFVRHTIPDTLDSQINNHDIFKAAKHIESIFFEVEESSESGGNSLATTHADLFNSIFEDGFKDEFGENIKCAARSFGENTGANVGTTDFSELLSYFGLFDSFIEIASVCAFPLDQKTRDSLKNAIFVSIGTNLVNFSNVDLRKDMVQIVKNVAASPSLGKLFDDFVGNMAYFFQAGEIVLFLCKMKESGIEPSIRKAVYLLESFNRRKGIDGGLCSEVSIRNKCWEPYKSISHVAAAMRITCQEFRSKHNMDGNPSGFFRLLSKLGIAPIIDLCTPILSISENIRGFLEQSIGSKSKAPLVDPEITWKVPPEIELPNESFNIAPLSDEELNILRQRFKRA